MPAVTQARNPRAKPPAKPSQRGRARATYATSKLSGAVGGGIGRGVGFAMAGVLLVGVAGLVLATGGRGAALAAGVSSRADAALGGLGLRVAHVELQGVSPGSARDILAAADVRAGQPILGLDLDAVRARVEGVGWVRSARVLRFLPDTVVIAAAERPRLAVWQLNGRTYVIDKEGAPIPEADAARFPALPLVVGEGANEAAGAVLPLVLARPRLLERVEALVRVDGRRWDLRLKDGGLIQLPATGEDGALIQLDQLDARARLLELGFARVDLRDPEMVTVRPRGAPAPAPTAATTTA